MKKELFLLPAILLFSLCSFAQVGQTLNVKNNTNCTVYFAIRANPSGNCTGAWSSAWIALAPMSANSYNASIIAGFTPSDDIVGADVYQAPNCVVTNYPVGDPGCYPGSNPSTPAFGQLDNTNCASTSCVSTYAVWGTVSPGVVTLTFFP